MKLLYLVRMDMAYATVMHVDEIAVWRLHPYDSGWSLPPLTQLSRCFVVEYDHGVSLHKLFIT